MLFNSLEFAFFLPSFFLLYWFLAKENNVRNTLIVVGSYFFYGWWDYRFLSLIFISTVIDFSIGSVLSQTDNDKTRKALLWLSLGTNLGLLAFFKYYNFFIDNIVGAFSFFGLPIQANRLHIILPVGISFYTFQTLSYTIDVYKRKIKPTKNFIAFAAFVSFFPQLVAGPIERASNLLPQFHSERTFSYSKAVDGLRQILWGLFKKIVIADNCAEYANLIFNHSTDYSGSTLLLGAVFFTFQIYGDFSGYSDIAIGTARLFGFNLKQNFAFPYFSRDIAEFWRRWHISLSTWFRDYLYIPIGGSRGGLGKKIRNTFIIFLVSGFWHGANWTFIIWGALNAIYFLPLLLTQNNRNHLEIVAKGKFLPTAKELFAMLTTFTLTVFAWIFFRAENISHAFQYLSEIFSPSLFSIPSIKEGISSSLSTIGFILIMLVVEWLGRENEFALEWKNKFPQKLNWLILLLIAICILENYSTVQSQEFIYFDF